jgi:hypothetical protein
VQYLLTPSPVTYLIKKDRKEGDELDVQRDRDRVFPSRSGFSIPNVTVGLPFFLAHLRQSRDSSKPRTIPAAARTNNNNNQSYTRRHTAPSIPKGKLTYTTTYILLQSITLLVPKTFIKYVGQYRSRYPRVDGRRDTGVTDRRRGKDG